MLGLSQSVQGKFDLERVEADLLLVLAPSVASQDYNDTQPSDTQHKRHLRYCFARCCILNVMLSVTFLLRSVSLCGVLHFLLYWMS